MGHPAIDNRSPFAAESLFLSDEDGRPLLVPVIKGTYAIQPGGGLEIAEEQVPVSVSGEYYGEAGKSSYKYEPEVAFVKLSTDVILTASAYPAGPGDTTTEVRLQAGDLRKSVLVTGDRYWIKSLGSVFMSSPEPFDKIPLVYERAFGGWDRSHRDPDRHAFEPRNPLGTGYRSKRSVFEEGVRLPNIEDPRCLVRNYGETPAPAGFGFISPDWQPRAALAGTYDSAWALDRCPLLPADFDRRFFNSASPGLTASGFLKGDEHVYVEGAAPEGPISFKLPAVAPPECVVRLRRGSTRRLPTQLDTVVIDAETSLVFLTWRANMALTEGPHDVASVEIRPAAVTLSASR